MKSSSPQPLHKDFKEFIELLNTNGVEYLIVGGYAMAAHGLPRFTGDIDFFIRRSHENARKICETLKQFGFESVGITLDDLMAENRTIQLGYRPVRIDILTRIEGVSFEDAWKCRVVLELDRQTALFIGAEHLLQNKLAVGRPQDLADVETLRRNLKND